MKKEKTAIIIALLSFTLGFKINSTNDQKTSPQKENKTTTKTQNISHSNRKKYSTINTQTADKQTTIIIKYNKPTTTIKKQILGAELLQDDGTVISKKTFNSVPYNTNAPTKLNFLHPQNIPNGYYILRTTLVTSQNDGGFKNNIQETYLKSNNNTLTEISIQTFSNESKINEAETIIN